MQQVVDRMAAVETTYNHTAYLTTADAASDYVTKADLATTLGAYATQSWLKSRSYATMPVVEAFVNSTVKHTVQRQLKPFFTNAAATYETKANAAATYETKTNAVATYIPKTSFQSVDNSYSCYQDNSYTKDCTMRP